MQIRRNIEEAGLKIRDSNTPRSFTPVSIRPHWTIVHRKVNYNVSLGFDHNEKKLSLSIDGSLKRLYYIHNEKRPQENQVGKFSNRGQDEHCCHILVRQALPLNRNSIDRNFHYYYSPSSFFVMSACIYVNRRTKTYVGKFTGFPAAPKRAKDRMKTMTEVPPSSAADTR